VPINCQTRAKEILEKESFVMLWADYVAKFFEYRVERILHMLPAHMREKIFQEIRNTLYTILEKKIKWASRTLHPKFRWFNSRAFHHVMVTCTGFFGGICGKYALMPELSATTFLMLRSISSIAASHGEDLNDLGTRLECISIFALGSPRTESDDLGEVGYYAARLSLAKMVNEATKYISTMGFSRTAPAVARFTYEVADRFAVVVSEKLAAQATPILGGLSAIVINNLFILHFNRIASAHFFIRLLERKYGPEMVREAYMKCLPSQLERKYEAEKAKHQQ